MRAITADGVALVRDSTSTLTAPAGTRRLEIEFVGLSFLAPQQNRYRYRLDGYDDAWVDGGVSRRATFTNVRPGAYTFRAQATNANGEWSDAALEASFNILPEYHQTLWFRVGMFGLITGALFGAYRVRVNRLLDLQRLRLRIASDLHDDIGSNLSSIALLSDMMQSRARSGETDQQQLARIQQTASGTMDALRDIIWLVNPSNDGLADFEFRLRGIATDLLGETTLQFDSRIDVSVPLGMSAKRHVLLLYKEALHNVRKHANARSVQVRVVVERARLSLTVADDGVGFDATASHTGYGLRSLAHRAEQLGGTLRIHAAPASGTTITLTVPLA
jgi:signal transduction histidine kinase